MAERLPKLYNRVCQLAEDASTMALQSKTGMLRLYAGAMEIAILFIDWTMFIEHPEQDPTEIQRQELLSSIQPLNRANRLGRLT